MSLYAIKNLIDGRSFDRLTAAEVFDKVQSDLDYSHWALWEKGTLVWTKLNDNSNLLNLFTNFQQLVWEPPVFDEKTKQSLLQANSPTNPQQTTEEKRIKLLDNSSDDFVIVKENSAVSTKPESERRKSPRVKCRWRTIITNQRSAFLTYTRDLSVGGLQVDDPIPAHILSGPVEIYIIGPQKKESLLFNCTAISGQNEYYRFVFADETQKGHERLQSWLIDLQSM